MPCLRQIRLAFCLIGLVLAACTEPVPDRDEAHPKRALGLFTTLPIYWGEGDIAAMIDADAPSDWVRAELEKSFELVPLDTLEAQAIAGIDQIILAQPRPLAPSENVAFDQWVRQGGRALILADPLLTRHSDYALGDRRRPQDVVLMSPLFDRWGLELLFDESQPSGEREEDLLGLAIPVELAGSFVLTSGGVGTVCRVTRSGILARCGIGEGEVTLIADAALLDWDGQGEVPAQRAETLEQIVRQSFDRCDTGNRGNESGDLRDFLCEAAE